MYLHRILKLIAFTLDVYGRWHLMRDINFSDFIVQLGPSIIWQHYVVWQPWLERYQEGGIPSALTVVLTLAVVGLRYWHRVIHR